MGYAEIKNSEKAMAQAKKELEELNGEINNIPFFDAREWWPQCVHPVRDQQTCGGCWAFATSESFSDRLCIRSNNTINQVQSVQQLISCNLWGLEGCSGGDPFTGYLYVGDHGLVSDNCYPYTSGAG